jgi:hypothetical protein
MKQVMHSQAQVQAYPVILLQSLVVGAQWFT